MSGLKLLLNAQSWNNIHVILPTNVPFIPSFLTCVVYIFLNLKDGNVFFFTCSIIRHQAEDVTGLGVDVEAHVCGPPRQVNDEVGVIINCV